MDSGIVCCHRGMGNMRSDFRSPPSSPGQTLATRRCPHPVRPGVLVPSWGLMLTASSWWLQGQSLHLDRQDRRRQEWPPVSRRLSPPCCQPSPRPLASALQARGTVYGVGGGQSPEAAQAQGESGATHTDCFTISEWILATPLTAWDPITHRWAMLIRLQSPSSITDILRRRSTSPGKRVATCCPQDREPWVGGLGPTGPRPPKGSSTSFKRILGSARSPQGALSPKGGSRSPHALAQGGAWSDRPLGRAPCWGQTGQVALGTPCDCKERAGARSPLAEARLTAF